MSAKHEYQSELFRHLVEQGRAEGSAEGRAEGEAKGKAEAILAVLAARGLAVPESTVVDIRAWRDLSELDRLLRRATLVATAGELIKSMPSPLHEQLIDLLRTRPALAADLLARAAGLPIAPAAANAARAVSKTFADPRLPEARADLIIQLGDPNTELAIIVEVQLAPDDEKRTSWPLYVAGLSARLRCPVWLLVVALDDEVATWSATSIDMGGMHLRPVVVRPGDIPTITDPLAARASPELAVLGALAHAGGPDGLTLCRVATDAILSQRLPARHACIDLMLSRLPLVARLALEKWMSARHECQSELFRQLVDQGKAEGKAEAILAVLAVRGLAVPEFLASSSS